MGNKIYKEKLQCNDIYCQYWEWRKNENKMCIKPKNGNCPLQSKKT
jgi:hypothetical protein